MMRKFRSLTCFRYFQMRTKLVVMRFSSAVEHPLSVVFRGLLPLFSGATGGGIFCGLLSTLKLSETG